MTAPTLTEFLLARIAEDAHEADSHPLPSRVLAECEAKRAIVAMLAYADDEGVAWVLERAVRILAAVYSEDPSYREEWRP